MKDVIIAMKLTRHRWVMSALELPLVWDKAVNTKAAVEHTA